MSEFVFVDLEKPIIDHEQDFKKAKIRMPRFRDFAKLGNPFVINFNKDGTGTLVDIDEVLQAYVEALVVEPVYASLEMQGTILDAVNVRGRVRNFFLERDAAKEASTTSRNNSSSASDGAPTT